MESQSAVDLRFETQQCRWSVSSVADDASRKGLGQSPLVDFRDTMTLSPPKPRSPSSPSPGKSLTLTLYAGVPPIRFRAESNGPARSRTSQSSRAPRIWKILRQDCDVERFTKQDTSSLIYI